jgi:hypothetical protein
MNSGMNAHPAAFGRCHFRAREHDHEVGGGGDHNHTGGDLGQVRQVHPPGHQHYGDNYGSDNDNTEHPPDGAARQWIRHVATMVAQVAAEHHVLRKP